ncbi:mRNA interferase MazF [Hamadaea flava]|uniref:Type II toxin-antitoxin system PemK/MazF family toxin n=1 Tax=Hamadaea flava TaxID=1742688 RepID=A0ABV8LGH0_9ACTN|nr:type II toxin-antitoxin system PemK/MazF family toxin [Hamadaea flava]MCP2325880.1 mRNA interferase MazF [Hamadaea flava]
MNRGVVWDYSPASGPSVRVVVLSNEIHNSVSWPVCAYLTRRATPLVPTMVPLADPDPVGGAVDLATLGTINPDRLSGPVGMLTGASLARIGEAVRALFGL